MRQGDVLHPGWSFGENVGYSIPMHCEGIRREGASLVHRMSFPPLEDQQLAL
jgi:ribonuclease HII